MVSFIVLCLFSINMSVLCGAKKAAADGSFVQAGLCGQWDDVRWQKEFSAMKEAGMHYLIIGAVAENYGGNTNYTLYPSSLSDTKLSPSVNGNDMVDICLRNAEKTGIKVFIGIGMNDKWWNAPGLDSTWLYNQMEFDNKVLDEVWDKYKNKYPNAFYGWYWVYEVANVPLNNLQLDVLIHAMNLQLDHMAAVNKKLPFMWCPFMESQLGTPEEYKKMWKYILAGIHTTDGDIFAPQDCVGAGWLKLDEVKAWFTALREAADTKPGLQFWCDVETFDHTDWTTATIGRFVKQMQIEQPYVDNYITFSYNHYNSPFNTDPGFHKTYIDYLERGSVETIPPSVPVGVKAEMNKDGNVMLSWNKSTDNIGVCGYYIYRNGEKTGKRQSARYRDDRNAEIKLDVNEYVDKNAEHGKNNNYRIQAFDFAGNVSGLSAPVEISVPGK